MANFDTKTTLPAGQYWIGDPCYVLHAEWSEICNDFFFATRNDHGCNEGEFTMKNGGRIFIGNTAYGDGYYHDNFNNGYGVDAGCIGIVPFDIIDQTDKLNDIRLGTVVNFDEDFEVSVDKGIFQFGNIVIDTAGEDDWEEPEFDDEEWGEMDYDEYTQL